MMFRNTSPLGLDNSESSQDNNSTKSVPKPPAMRRNNSRGFDQMRPLGDYTPGPDDVLVGRGKKCLVHSGNIRFKEIVATKLSAYLAAECRVDKTAILMEVIAQVRTNSPNGGFIKQNPKTGQYFEVGDFLAKEKTAQAFRDALHEYYSSSNPSKKKRRIQSTISAEKKQAALASGMISNNSSSSILSIPEEEDNSEFSFASSPQNTVTEPQTLLMAMQTQFTRQSSVPMLYTRPTQYTREVKSAPSSPQHNSVVLDPPGARASTPPPCFARFVSSEARKMPQPSLLEGELLEDGPFDKRKSSVILGGETLAMLSSLLPEPQISLDEPLDLGEDPFQKFQPIEATSDVAAAAPAAAAAAAPAPATEDPFEPIPLSVYEDIDNLDMDFSS